ncbi:hypothetical protein LZ198_40270 [Myxococcus sp. K15C18031901]|uniref:hypothetical protein n=1 Tax=Myxococcus dinghuensis TaxID=2906761 RepID=UPI0020A7382C|nr:hypothetical protein [Myxococcus dinghuensis]MCP3105122.1 hypothetical protein [Myxococcus dinghuensis]
MNPSTVMASRRWRLGSLVLLVVCGGSLGCQRAPEPASPEASPAVSAASASPPFDVQAIVRRVERSFRAVEGGGFTGHQPTYALEVAASGAFLFAPRHIEEAMDTASRDSVAGKVAGRPVTGAPVTLRTLSVSRGGRGLDEAPAASLREGGALSLGRGPVVEVLENRDGGLEQRWEWASAPAGAGALEVRVAVSGLTYAGRTEHGHHFVDAASGLGVRYGRATWVDARGRRTDIETVRDADALVMRVPEEVLAESAWPAVLDPLVSPELSLDTPIPVPNLNGSTDAVVALGGGVYLVAWTHVSWNFSLYDESDIQFVRVRASDGKVLDVGSLALAGGRGTQRSITVASNGRDFLAVWSDWQLDDRTGPVQQLRGARIRASDGRVIDAGLLPISDAPGNQSNPAIASDGTDYFVVWSDYRNGSGPQVYGTRVRASDGVVLDLDGRFITQGLCSGIAYGGGVYLLLSENSGLRLRASDLVLLGGFPISTGRNPFGGMAAFDGQQFLVVWTDFRNGSNNPDVFAARVSVDGVVLDRPNLPIAVAAGRQEAASVASTGQGFLVVWQHETANQVTDVFAAPVSSEGVVGAAAPLGAAASASVQEKLPGVASDGSTYFVVWHGVAPGATSVVSGARVSASGGALDTAQLLSAEVSMEYTPAVAFAEGVHLVVWADDRGTRGKAFDILGARVRDSDGVVLDAPALRIATTPRLETAPSVATDGTQFLVVFQSRPTGSSADTDILAVRVRASDGAVLDATPRPLFAASLDQDEPSVAYGEGYFLVAWADTRPGGFYSTIYFTRVRAADGQVMEPLGVAFSASSSQSRPVVAYGGGHFLVAYEESRSNGRDLLARRIRAVDGVVRETSGIVLSQETWSETRATVAFDGTHFLVAWEDRRYVLTQLYGRRVRASDGAVVDATPVGLATQLMYHSKPALAFDGARYLLAWSRVDHPAGSIPGVVGRRFSPSLTPLDATPFLVSGDAAGGEGSHVAVASSKPGRFLVAYHDRLLHPRVRARFVFEPLLNGTSCAEASHCASGFCVDGVCCDAACGGGVAGDCRACAVLAGGTTDGVCGPVRRETETMCRASAGACDAAETCDGFSTECPVDAPAVDGTACSDGNACTRTDTCQAGVCRGGDVLQCPAGDGCRTASTCQPWTGRCSTPLKLADGLPCDDGDACTLLDVCRAGTCVGGSPVVCAVEDACLMPGTCDPATGTCSDPTRRDEPVCWEV